MRRLLLSWLGLVSLGFGGGLTFPETTKQLKATLEDSIVTTDFAFTNKTAKVIEIKQVQPSCSCISAGVEGGKLRYAPGESGVIRTKFDMGASTGDVEKQVAVFVDDDKETSPSATLKLDVHIPVVFNIEPKTAKWDTGSDPAPKTLTFTVEGADPIHVKQVTCSNPAFKFELKTVEDGRRYELTITPSDTKATSIGAFRIDTDCKIERHRAQQAYAVIRPPVNSDSTPKKK